MAIQPQGEEDTIRFKWAFVTMSGPSLNPRLTPIQSDTSLTGGQRVKMLVEIGRENAPEYVYVLYHGTTGGVQTLFPYKLEASSGALKSNRYYIPKGPKWLTLDRDKGEGTVYVLASKSPFEALEALLRKAPDTPEAEREALDKQIIGEIRNLVRQNRSFARRAERPLSIGGEVRAAQVDLLGNIAKYAREVTSGAFYFKSYTIAHE